MSAPNNETVVIKKYANRRLYNTATSTYVTLENLAQMVKEGTEFNVYDAKTNEDITRSVLTQIIVEEEGKSGPNNLLPIGFLRKLISFYGDNMQWLVPKYLEHSMQSLTKNQEQIRNYFQTTLGMFPFGSTLEQMSKQNMAMFERTMKMFTPFGMQGSDSSGSGSDDPVPPPDSESPSSSGTPSSSSSYSAAPSSSSSKPSRAEAQEAAEEAAFTPSVVASSSGSSRNSRVTPMPTPETTRASQSTGTGDDVQNKIAALQRQLSDLAKNKA